ncbi:ABC-ATPase domain-containing protein [Boudabousia marimammalium]|uniref:ABC-ATPase domain-containing protein n=1 Tax=Boudabousia marimammalium TaxID=156892 RepID=UPI0013012445|nr:ABC-ATPase domain-containing protein [Boudabousia marimammalium]
MDSDLSGLLNALEKADGRNYGAYKSMIGQYRMDIWRPGAVLYLDRVQSDPYAPPSDFRLRLGPQQLPFADQWWEDDTAREAIADYLARRLCSVIHSFSPARPHFSMAQPGQEILRRSSVMLAPHPDIPGLPRGMELRFRMQLPARGRSILGKTAADLIEYDLIDILDEAIFRAPKQQLEKQIQVLHDYRVARNELEQRGLVAFIADGSLLARESGVSDRPLQNAIKTTAPESLAVTMDLPYAGPTRGLGIKSGLTLIVGGGFHGKSTLLRAVERGIYPHIPGDGRELVVTNPTAMKLRAEDGRPVQAVCINDFISDLPSGVDTLSFSTENASGSTSQAAAIVEAVESGSKVLLLDEDTSATNLLIRDPLMRCLVPSEPITPLVDRVEEMVAAGLSLIIVMGGSSDYLPLANQVILLEDYLLHDVTERSRSLFLGKETEVTNRRGDAQKLALLSAHRPWPRATRLGDRLKLKTQGVDAFSINHELVDLRAVEQLVDSAQTALLARVIVSILGRSHQLRDQNDSLTQLIDSLLSEVRQKGLGALGTQNPLSGDLAEVRTQEIHAALSRLRSLRFE